MAENESPTGRGALARAADVLGDWLGDALPSASQVEETAVGVYQDVVAAEQKVERAAAHVSDEMKAALAVLEEKPAYERVVDVLERRLGMRRSRDQDLPGLTLQVQHMKEYTGKDGKRLGRYLVLRFSAQIAAKVELNSAAEVGKATMRFDKTGLKQAEIEFPWNLRGPTKAADDDWIVLSDVRPKLSLDNVPGKPALATQAGVEWTVLSPRLSFLNADGKPYSIKLKTAVKIDLVKLLTRPKGMDVQSHLSQVLSLQFEMLPVVASLDDVWPFRDLKKIVGGKWSCQLKFFVNLAGTVEFWIRAFNLSARAAAALKTAAVEGALMAKDAVVVAGRAAVSAGQVAVEVAAPLALPAALAAVGVAVTVAGLYAIRHALESGRDQAVLQAYYSGYATELEGAVLNPIEWLVAEGLEFEMYDFKAAVEEISAHVHGRTPPQFYRVRSSGSRNVDFARALNKGAVDLGRASVIVGICSIVQQQGREAWLEVRAQQRARLEQRRGAGETTTLKRLYLEALTLKADPLFVGLPLRHLDQVV